MLAQHGLVSGSPQRSPWRGYLGKCREVEQQQATLLWGLGSTLKPTPDGIVTLEELPRKVVCCCFQGCFTCCSSNRMASSSILLFGLLAWYSLVVLL